ncbi:hypothetical protein [Pleurocapsa sp. FMAR1]|uniref:hypothetical protein n=1 Tax=Pleurocapsa sp. FMAR1 TaxID=3040204 RepID=UPI0029C7F753|nr:hypothetical protein [Pleurocapsa sp. FMAR1]
MQNRATSFYNPDHCWVVSLELYKQRFEAVKELVYQSFRELQLEPLTMLQIERLICTAIALLRS